MKDLKKVLRNQSLRTQLIAGFVLILVVFMSLFTYNVISRQKKFLAEKARERVVFQTEVLASAAVEPTLQNDAAALKQILAPLAKDSNIRFALVSDTAGRILAHTDDSLVGRVLVQVPDATRATDAPDAARGPEDGQISEVESAFRNAEAGPVEAETRITLLNDELIEASAPLVSDGKVIGWALSARDPRADLTILGDVTRMGVTYTLLALVMGALLAVYFGNRLLKGLTQLIEGAATHLTQDDPMPLPVSSRGSEVGQLTHTFNQAIKRLNEHRHELERAKDKAEAANVAKSNFLANISHEIRTPLGAVIGFANMLQDTGLTPHERQQYQDILNRNGKELQRMIKNLLDISKVEAGGVELDIATFRPRELIQDVCDTLKPKAEAKGLTLWCKVEDNVPNDLRSDALRVRQVLINLVENAIKFTEHGGVAITMRGPTADDSGHFRVEIEDTGLGLSVEQQDGLFQAFAQVDESLTRKFGGAGLGLYLARKLALKLGGDIRVLESEPGLGSTFLFTLKDQVEELADRQPETLTAPASAAYVQNDEKPLAGLHILAVEDVKDNQLLIESLLSKRGAVVECADNGVEGVQKATHAEYDAVLMDIQMPLLDGYRAVKKLRRLGFKKPIVALTAHALVEDRERCLAGGFDEYITKPINPSDLINVILRLANQQVPA